MEVILLEDIFNLGEKNDIVIVKNGYGRNFLIPQKKAILAIPSEKKVVLEAKKQRLFREEKIKNKALGIADRLKSFKIKIGAKTSSTGKIFGSVNTIQIADVIARKGFEIDRKKIKIKDEDNIKSVGKYTAEIKLHKEVIVELDFEVVSE